MDAECIKYAVRIKGAVFEVFPHFSSGHEPFFARDIKAEEREGRLVFVCITLDGDKIIPRADVHNIEPRTAEEIFKKINHERRLRLELQERLASIRNRT